MGRSCISHSAKPMASIDLVVRFAGEAGDGVITLGDIFVKACIRNGLDAFTFRSYPTEVRGGHVMFQVRLSTEDVINQGDWPNILVAFTKKKVERYIGDLHSDGILIVDSAVAEDVQDVREILSIPLGELSKTFGRDRRNMIFLGVCTKYLGLDEAIVRQLIQERFGRAEEALRLNMGAFDSGWNYCDQKGWRYPQQVDVQREGPRLYVLSGNEAISMGAIAAGCRYFAGYPITPASEILEYLASVLPRFEGKVLQVEDEMAALASVIGASFAGVKAMTATSGPGFSLMGELIGYASMAEIPVVIVDAQRVGPSTGIPTSTEQSDLLLAIHSSHGESPRIVLAPANVEECFYLTIEAFNLAETYQMPVILLSDLALSHRLEAVPHFDLEKVPVVNRLYPAKEHMTKYQRFEITERGVSPMAIPGTDGIYPAMGIEHDERGYPSYIPETRTKMTEKRFRKLAQVDADRFVRMFGDPEATTGIIGWGSTEGAIVEAIDRLAKDGLPVHGLQLKMLWPLPINAIMNFMEWKKTVFVAELNRTGQCARLLRSELGIKTKSINKYVGLPFRPSEIVETLKEVAGGE